MIIRLRPALGAQWFPVEVTLHGDPVGRELVDAMVSAQLVEVAERSRLVLERTRRALDVDEPLRKVGLRHGDLVSIDGAGPEKGPAAVTKPWWELVVASGPDAPASMAVGGTGLVVGRGQAADFVITDGSLSREHFEVQMADGAPTIQDLGSQNGTFHAGFRVGATPTIVVPDLPVEAGESLFRLRTTHRSAEAPLVQLRAGLAHVNRVPRMAPAAEGRTLDLAAPPQPRQPRRIPLIAACVPLVIAPVIVMSGGNGVFLLMMLLSPLMMLGGWYEDRLHGGKDHREEITRFHEQTSATATSLREAVRADSEARWASAPDPAELLDRTRPSRRLWERSRGDADFLGLRVGWTEQPSRVSYRLGEGGQADLREQARRMLDPIQVSTNLPATITLSEIGSLAVVSRDQDKSMARWLLFQLGVLHSPRDLRLAAIVPDPPTWGWLGRLPHADWPAEITAVTGATGAPELLAVLTQEIGRRADQTSSVMGGRQQPPAVVVLVDDQVALPRNAVTRLLEDGPAVGVHVIWLTDSPGAVPAQCRGIVTVETRHADIVWVDTGHRLPAVALDRISFAEVDEAAWQLAGLRDADTQEAGGGLPSRVSLADVLDMPDPSPELIRARWESASGLGAPLGVALSGTFRVDLRQDGPHGLLGGTTGAGKSELLQTLVASFAASHSPRDLTFLLVDYKGGAAFKDCVDLPHTVGYVTDLDGHLVLRVLSSLHAELSHRERQLAAVGAKDLLDMRVKAPDAAPPSLLLVVDEFAALAAELPEFVDGMVNLAQRGRSLGMHLLLATQRPAGAINDNIRANTNLRMSLRMNDRSDSDDVIGSPVAAELPRSVPGRAFVRTGSTELVEVQVAYGGGQSFGKVASQAASVTLEFADQPATTVVRRGDLADPPQSDLQRLAAVIAETFAQSGSETPRRPWLPALPELLPAADLPAGEGSVVHLGLRDEPHHQAQLPHAIDVTEGGVLIAGSAGVGKTTALLTLLGLLAEQLPPDRLHLYALDFGSRGLASLMALPHTGDVVLAEETDRVVRLLGTLQAEIARRRALLTEYRAAGFEPLQQRMAEAGLSLPLIVVALDGYGSFAHAFDRVDFGAWVDRFPTLVNEGRAVGVHWVVTVDRRLAMPLAAQSALPQRLVLRFNDTDEYDGFGLARSRVAGAHLPPGRGFGATSDEVQVAILGADPSLAAQAEALIARGAVLGARWPAVDVPRVRLLDDWVPVGVLAPATALGAVPFGLADGTFAAATVDLVAGGLLVAGAKRSGKSTTLTAVGHALRTLDDIDLRLLAPRRTPLQQLDWWTDARSGLAACEELVEELLLDVDERSADAPWLVLVIDDAEEFVDQLCEDRLVELIKRGAERRLRVVAAADKRAALRSYGGLIQRLRAERRGIVLQPDPDSDADIFDAVVDRRLRGGPPGRALLMEGGAAVAVQVATLEERP